MVDAFAWMMTRFTRARLRRGRVLAAMAAIAAIAVAAVPAAGDDAVLVPGPTIETGDRVLGNAGAPITVYEYTSYLCSDCREYRWAAHMQVLRRLAGTGQIRIVQRDFPLSELAFTTAVVARCVPPENYDRMVVELFWFQHVWSAMADPLEGLSDTALAFGVPRDAFAACLKDQAAIDRVAETFAAGQSLYGVKTLPTFFFVMDDTVIRAEGLLTLKDFKEIIATLKKEAKG